MNELDFMLGFTLGAITGIISYLIIMYFCEKSKVINVGYLKFGDKVRNERGDKLVVYRTFENISFPQVDCFDEQGSTRFCKLKTLTLGWGEE